MNQRQIDDCSRAMGKALLDRIRHCFREEEHRDIWETFTDVCKAGLEAFCMQQDRMRQRMRPTKN